MGIFCLDMYQPKTDDPWEKLNIQEVDCWIPPEGYVWNPLELKLEWVGVEERLDDEGDQVWIPDQLPEEYYDLRIEEEFEQEEDPSYEDPALAKMRNLFWHRRLCGMWIYINGKATFITGLHYFYLSWWKIDIGLPSYRDNDRLYFYFLQQGVDDPRCLGSLKVTKRRGGKTFQLGCFIYERISRMVKANGGIQSKTDKDAQDKVYREAVRMPFDELPDFFVPKYDPRKVEKKIDFSIPTSRAVKGRKTRARKTHREFSLKSVIDARSAVEMAYDGMKLHAYGSDECSKLEKYNIFERHMVVRFCLEQEETIIGYAVYTTTVEDMKGQNEEFRKLWNYSDPRVRTKNGRTKSGMYRYFEPATRTLYFDKFGMPDEQKAMDYINAEAEALKDDRKAYISFRKKNPLSIEHAFLVDDGTSPFDQLKLNEQKDIIEWSPEGMYTKNYRLRWENDMPYTRVIAIPDPNGPFEIHELPPEALQNNVSSENGRPSPGNKDWYTAGLDPFKFNNTTSEGSKAGFVIKKRFWPQDILDSNKPVLLYLHRPNTKEKMYEDIIKAAWLYGTDILSERNVGAFDEWLGNEDLEEFGVYINGEFGVYATNKSNEKLVEYLEDYIFNNCDNVFMGRLVSQALRFDPNRTQDFDGIMGWGYAEMLDKIRLSVKRRKVNKSGPTRGSSLQKVLKRHPVK